MTKLFIILSLLFANSVLGSETVKGMRKDVQNFKQEMTEKINEAEKQISLIKERAKQKKDNTADKAIIELEQARDNLKSQLSEMTDSTGKKWKSVKQNMGQSLDSLNSKIQKVLKE